MAENTPDEQAQPNAEQPRAEQAPYPTLWEAAREAVAALGGWDIAQTVDVRDWIDRRYPGLRQSIPLDGPPPSPDPGIPDPDGEANS